MKLTLLYIFIGFILGLLRFFVTRRRISLANGHILGFGMDLPWNVDSFRAWIRDEWGPQMIRAGDQWRVDNHGSRFLGFRIDHWITSYGWSRQRWPDSWKGVR